MLSVGLMKRYTWMTMWIWHGKRKYVDYSIIGGEKNA